MDKYPLVSVVMPFFNSEKFIETAIKSILNQTYANIEFIIINDGSIDCSSQIVEKIKDSRILYINNDFNQGNYTCRNQGCKIANGKYVCVMDSDDIAHSDRIRIQVEYIEKDPLTIACGSFFELLDGQKCIKPIDYESIRVYLLHNNMFLHPSLLIRTETIKKINYYDETFFYSSDYDLVCRLSLIGKISNIPENLMCYRYHNEQISTAKRQDQIAYADRIRINYLRALGFRLDHQMETNFTYLMKSESHETLDAEILYLLYKDLIFQNQKLNCLNNHIFNEFLMVKIKNSLELINIYNRDQ